jgi:hypothetical protein
LGESRLGHLSSEKPPLTPRLRRWGRKTRPSKSLPLGLGLPSPAPPLSLEWPLNVTPQKHTHLSPHPPLTTPTSHHTHLSPHPPLTTPTSHHTHLSPPWLTKGPGLVQKSLAPCWGDNKGILFEGHLQSMHQSILHSWLSRFE